MVRTNLGYLRYFCNLFDFRSAQKKKKKKKKSNVSFKQLYKTSITRYGTTQSFDRTAAYLPNPKESKM